MGTIYYRTRDDRYHREFAVQEAYYLATGMRAEDMPEKYQKWVDFRCKKGYFVKCTSNEIEVTATLYAKQPTLASMLYRDKNGGTLLEAHNTLKTMLGR